MLFGIQPRSAADWAEGRCILGQAAADSTRQKPAQAGAAALPNQVRASRMRVQRQGTQGKVADLAQAKVLVAVSIQVLALPSAVSI